VTDQTRIIAVANQKGGVGKTTTVINLAACIAEKNYRVLVVDLDPQANATSGLGLTTGVSGSDLFESLIGEMPLSDSIITSSFSGIDIIPSDPDLAASEIHIARMDSYLTCFKQSVEPLVASHTYDFIIIDCPPSLGILTMNALTAADSILIPIQCEYYALEGLSVIIKFIRELQESGANPDLTVEGILMTMYDGRTNLSAQVVLEVRGYFGDQVYQTVIPRNVRLGEAPSHGCPAVHYDKNATGSCAYRQFTEEFLEQCTRPVPTPVIETTIPS